MVEGFKQVFYRCYVDNIFVLFKSNDHLKYFQEFLNSCHINMPFSMKTERHKFSFLDIEVICKQGKFWTFHAELTFLKTIFRKNGYPENFIDKCFKEFLDNIHLVKEKVSTVERNRLLLVLPYLGVISLQTRTKLQQAIKGF